MPPQPTRTPEIEQRRLLAELRTEGHAALATPRQLTRFLCGLRSPATTQTKLSKDPRFGALADVPFAAVLALAEASASAHGSNGSRLQFTPGRRQRRKPLPVP